MNVKNIILMLALVPTICFSETIGIIGDSITVPINIPRTEGYAYNLEKKLGVKVLNHSISGSRTGSLLIRTKAMYKDNTPDILIIALGVNDAYFCEPQDSVLANIAATLDFLAQQNVKVLIGTIDTAAIGWHGAKYSQEFQQLYDKLHQAYPQVIFFPFITARVLEFAPDGLHPDARGHRLIANEIIKTIKQKS